jgi:hypothetical protein
VSFGESYVLRIASLPNAAVRVRYSVDGGEIAEFETSLDGKGEVKFDITPTTPKGDYKLISFRRAGDGNWTDSEVTIRVK